MNKYRQHTNFDTSLVKKKLIGLVPDGFEIHRMDNCLFTIESKWKRGKLVKLYIDRREIYLNDSQREAAEDNINTILYNSRDFKSRFTGSVKFRAEKAGGELKEVYVGRSHFAIRKRRERTELNDG